MRQHSVAARLSTLDPDILCVQNKCGHIFPSTASKSLLLSASFLSTPNMPEFFPGEMTLALRRGDLASLLAVLPFSWDASRGVCSDAGVGMWLTAELEWLFPIWFRAAVRDNECQYLTAGACFCCVYVFVMFVISELPLCWEAALLFVNACSCKGTYKPELWSANHSLHCCGSQAKKPS